MKLNVCVSFDYTQFEGRILQSSFDTSHTYYFAICSAVSDMARCERARAGLFAGGYSGAGWAVSAVGWRSRQKGLYYEAVDFNKSPGDLVRL